MNSTFNKAVLICALSLATSLAAHADNKITFTGKVIDSACTISVNGGVATLDLGETSASATGRNSMSLSLNTSIFISAMLIPNT